MSPTGLLTAINMEILDPAIFIRLNPEAAKFPNMAYFTFAISSISLTRGQVCQGFT